MKLVRDTSTPERRAFWEGVAEASAALAKLPRWAQAGVLLNPQTFETYEPQDAPTEAP